MSTADFDTWKSALLAKESDLSAHFAAFPGAPCGSGEQLTGAFNGWKSSHQAKLSDLTSHGSTMPASVCESPLSGPFFDGTAYTLAAAAIVPAFDLSGLSIHPTTGNLWALNENPGVLYELNRDGVILRTVTLTSASGIDLEGLAYVDSNASGDTFAVFNTLLGGRKLTVFEVPTGTATVNLDNGANYATTKTWESLAYEPAAETFHLWADRDYTLFVADANGAFVEQYQFDPKYKPAPRACESLDFNAAASPHLFHWTQTGFCKEVNKTAGAVVSQANFATFPGWVAGKWEGHAVEAGTRAVFLVREASAGQVNFQRWERAS